MTSTPPRKSRRGSGHSTAGSFFGARASGTHQPDVTPRLRRREVPLHARLPPRGAQEPPSAHTRPLLRGTQRTSRSPLSGLSTCPHRLCRPVGSNGDQPTSLSEGCAGHAGLFSRAAYSNGGRQRPDPHSTQAAQGLGPPRHVREPGGPQRTAHRRGLGGPSPPTALPPRYRLTSTSCASYCTSPRPRAARARVLKACCAPSRAVTC